MSTQFPPSSPLRDTKEAYDPFAARAAPVRAGARDFDYPTPNPSSTVGRSSSPARGGDDSEPRKVAFAVDKPVKRSEPFSAFKITKVPLVSGHFTVGRSAENAVRIKTTDTTVSRKHIAVDARKSELEVRCLGHNGFGIIIPKTCGIASTDKPGTYKLEEIAEPLDSGDVTKSVKLDHNHTEFNVLKNESVIMPRCYNVIIELKSNLLILNPNLEEEEATEDEMPVLRKECAEAEPVETPLKVLHVDPRSPKLKSSFKITEEEPTPIKSRVTIANPLNTDSFTIHQDSSTTNKMLPVRQATPLNDKSNNVQHILPSRKAQSEEPQSHHVKKIKRETSLELESIQKKNKVDKEASAEPEELDPSILDDIDNLQEVNNILVNHLAFSRLSSTPISTLRSISKVTSQLDTTQLRTILQELKSVGVIYRVGKDAAGKSLEEEYYYIPEEDDDQERPKLVAAIKGHGGLRSCRRTHKQYYWKKPAPKKKDHKPAK